MKKFAKIVLGLILILIVGGVIAWFGFLKPEPPPISDEDRAQISLMPLPSELDLNGGYFEIGADLGHSVQGPMSDKVESGIKRFYARLTKITNTEIKNNGNPALVVKFKKANDRYPSLTDDESYAIDVSDSKIELSANSDTGILHGLESLLQLVKQDGNSWVIPQLQLKDDPRFSWRGLMIDVSRHWVDKETILRNLDAMAAVKMNVFHWHLTDFQGFRIESKKYPKLHEMGSEGNYYSQEDIGEVLDYAADRGIRVVPEFDLPGHSTSWFVGHPELASSPGPYVLDSVFGILDPVMDPTRDEVYDFLDGFIGEMSKLFPDRYMHIGGDEVKPKQWKENEAVQKFMEENEIGDTHELQAYFNSRLQKIVEKHGKQMMGWDEIIHPDLPKNGIAVQSWRSHASLWNAARSGYKTILSSGYYLDHKRPASFHYSVNPMKIDGGVTIEIDSTNWKGYQCKLLIQDTEIEGHLYLFGQGENLRGIMDFMGDASDFSNVKTEGNTMEFDIEASVGTINFEVAQQADSIMGEAKIALFSLDLKGKLVGGSEMPDGIDLPKFEKIEPLTLEQEQNILGGEACMWAEMVDNRTIESRIWPRAAAIAEKLWSPEILTNNVEDMYRRLMELDNGLEKMGIHHKVNTKEIISEMVTERYFEPVKTLVDVLQEDEFFNRMQIYGSQMKTTTPLNRMVDAAPAESYVAYLFNRDVDRWLQVKDPQAKERITENLLRWSENHSKLLPVFDSSQPPNEDVSVGLTIEQLDRLNEVKEHSENLSQLSKLALESIENTGAEVAISELDSLLIRAKEPKGGTVLPVVDGLQKLLKN